METPVPHFYASGSRVNPVVHLIVNKMAATEAAAEFNSDQSFDPGLFFLSRAIVETILLTIHLLKSRAIYGNGAG